MQARTSSEWRKAASKMQNKPFAKQSTHFFRLPAPRTAAAGASSSVALVAARTHEHTHTHTRIHPHTNTHTRIHPHMNTHHTHTSFNIYVHEYWAGTYM